MNKEDIKDLVRKELVDGILKTQEFYVVGNWKMNKSKPETIEFLDQLANVDFGQKNHVVVIPPFPYLYLFEEKLRYSKIEYGVQNLFPKPEGAFTGEVSYKMALEFGARYAIVGHSERRNLFLEDDVFISKKVRICVQNRITPILCVGEDLTKRQKNTYHEFLKTQIREGLSRITGGELEQVIIAYEPIWAIGTGVNATPEQVEKTHMFIRRYLVESYGEKSGTTIPILYGGSVKVENVKELALAQSVSGFLIGGASLDPKSFVAINNILNGK